MKKAIKEIITLESNEMLVQSHIWCLAVDKKRNILYAGLHDGKIEAFDLEQHKNIFSLVGHKGIVYTLRISKDGKTLYSGGMDQIIRIWDLEKRSLSSQLRGHRNVVYSLILSSNEDFLVSGSEEGIIRRWCLSSQECQYTVEGFNAALSALVLKNDHLVISVDDTRREFIKIFDFKLLKIVAEFRSGNGEVFSLVMSKDGAILYSAGSDMLIHSWDLNTFKEIANTQAHTKCINELELSSKGSHLFSCSDDCLIKIWVVDNGILSLLTAINHGCQVLTVSLSSDDQLMFSAGKKSKPVKMWDVSSLYKVNAAQGESGKRSRKVSPKPIERKRLKKKLKNKKARKSSQKKEGSMTKNKSPSNPGKVIVSEKNKLSQNSQPRSQTQKNTSKLPNTNSTPIKAKTFNCSPEDQIPIKMKRSTKKKNNHPKSKDIEKSSGKTSKSKSKKNQNLFSENIFSPFNPQNLKPAQTENLEIEIESEKQSPSLEEIESYAKKISKEIMILSLKPPGNQGNGHHLKTQKSKPKKKSKESSENALVYNSILNSGSSSQEEVTLKIGKLKRIIKTTDGKSSKVGSLSVNNRASKSGRSLNPKSVQSQSVSPTADTKRTENHQNSTDGTINNPRSGALTLETCENHPSQNTKQLKFKNSNQAIEIDNSIPKNTRTQKIQNKVDDTKGTHQIDQNITLVQLNPQRKVTFNQAQSKLLQAKQARSLTQKNLTNSRPKMNQNQLKLNKIHEFNIKLVQPKMSQIQESSQGNAPPNNETDISLIQSQSSFVRSPELLKKGRKEKNQEILDRPKAQLICEERSNPQTKNFEVKNKPRMTAIELESNPESAQKKSCPLAVLIQNPDLKKKNTEISVSKSRKPMISKSDNSRKTQKNQNQRKEQAKSNFGKETKFKNSKLGKKIQKIRQENLASTEAREATPIKRTPIKKSLKSKSRFFELSQQNKVSISGNKTFPKNPKNTPKHSKSLKNSHTMQDQILSGDPNAHRMEANSQIQLDEDGKLTHALQPRTIIPISIQDSNLQLKKNNYQLNKNKNQDQKFIAKGQVRHPDLEKSSCPLVSMQNAILIKNLVPKNKILCKKVQKNSKKSKIDRKKKKSHLKTPDSTHSKRRSVLKKPDFGAKNKHQMIKKPKINNLKNQLDKYKDIKGENDKVMWSLLDNESTFIVNEDGKIKAIQGNKISIISDDDKRSTPKKVLETPRDLAEEKQGAKDVQHRKSVGYVRMDYHVQNQTESESGKSLGEKFMTSEELMPKPNSRNRSGVQISPPLERHQYHLIPKKNPLNITQTDMTHQILEENTFEKKIIAQNQNSVVGESQEDFSNGLGLIKHTLAFLSQKVTQLEYTSRQHFRTKNKMNQKIKFLNRRKQRLEERERKLKRDRILKKTEFVTMRVDFEYQLEAEQIENEENIRKANQEVLDYKKEIEIWKEKHNALENEHAQRIKMKARQDPEFHQYLVKVLLEGPKDAGKETTRAITQIKRVKSSEMEDKRTKDQVCISTISAPKSPDKLVNNELEETNDPEVQNEADQMKQYSEFISFLKNENQELKKSCKTLKEQNQGMKDKEKEQEYAQRLQTYEKGIVEQEKVSLKKKLDKIKKKYKRLKQKINAIPKIPIKDSDYLKIDQIKAILPILGKRNYNQLKSGNYYEHVNPKSSNNVFNNLQTTKISESKKRKPDTPEFPPKNNEKQTSKVTKKQAIQTPVKQRQTLHQQRAIMATNENHPETDIKRRTSDYKLQKTPISHRSGQTSVSVNRTKYQKSHISNVDQQIVRGFKSPSMVRGGTERKKKESNRVIDLEGGVKHHSEKVNKKIDGEGQLSGEFMVEKIDGAVQKEGESLMAEQPKGGEMEDNLESSQVREGTVGIQLSPKEQMIVETCKKIIEEPVSKVKQSIIEEISRSAQQLLKK